MSKKPASLTSDLLARKGEAAPSPADPSSRVTLTAGRQPDLGGFGSGFGRPEGPFQGPDASPATERPEMQGMDEEERPRPPEPEIIYTPEDYEGGGRTRLVAGALVGLALIVGVVVALSLNDGSDTEVAPLSSEIIAPPATTQSEPMRAETTPEAAPAPAPELAAAPEDAAPAVAAEAEATAPEAAVPEVETAEVDAAPEAAATGEPEALVPAQAAPTPAPAMPAPAATAAVPATGGAFVVQLAAVREEAAAGPAYKALQDKHAALLGGHALDVERADLGERGIFYRVRAAGFATRDAAVRTCASLKAAGQDCMVRPR